MKLIIMKVTDWMVKIMEDVTVIMLIINITVTIWVIKIIEDVTLKLIIMNVTVWIVKIMEDVTLILVIMQGWEFAHLLIAHSLNCSFCSNQMSDCERFAQDK